MTGRAWGRLTGKCTHIREHVVSFLGKLPAHYFLSVVFKEELINKLRLKSTYASPEGRGGVGNGSRNDSA